MSRRINHVFDGSALENQDSDLSDSGDDESLEIQRNELMISVDGTENRMVLSQLHFLEESFKHQFGENFISSQEDIEGCSPHDDIENPVFDDGIVSNSVMEFVSSTAILPIKEEIIPSVASISHSDEEKCDQKKNQRSEWSAANREVESLVQLNEKRRYSHATFVRENKSYPGGVTGKSKPKFLFSHHPNKEGDSSVASKNAETFSDNFLVLDEIADEDNERLEHKHHLEEQSGPEFLNCFKQRSHLLQPGNSEPTVILDCDDELPEASEYASYSDGDDEENPKIMDAIIHLRTMGDQFHDAVETIPSDDQRPCSSGMHAKLQQVMQIEKDIDMDSMKYIGTKTRHYDKEMRLFVKILSKVVEAKLIVCSCIYCRDANALYVEYNSQVKMKDEARTLSVIFNPRLCNDVELEIGNLICIHHPWKEVYVKEKDEVVYLCSYFSQI